MDTLQELKGQIEKANALGIKNLNEKGIMLVGSPGVSGIKPVTTYQIMKAIADIQTNGEDDGGGSALSVEYIESTGTQYIDTGIIPTNHRVKIKFQKTDNEVGSVLGSYGNKLSAELYNVYELVWYDNEWYYAPSSNIVNGGRQDSFSSPVNSTDVIELDFNTYDNKIIMNGTVVADTYGTSNAVLPLYLFVQSGNMIAFSKMKLWYAQIYDRDTQKLVRDFVPAVDKNGVICLYDNVTETYFYNQGTGVFGGEFEKVGIEPLENTVTFTVDGEPYEIVSVRSGNSINKPATEPTKEGFLSVTWEAEDGEISFPFTPTEDCELSCLFSEWGVVRTLTSDDIIYGKGMLFTNPYTSTTPPYTSETTTRAGYFYEDIPIEYGYTYKFDFVSTSANTQIALVFFTQNSLDKMDNYLSLEGTCYDTGWQENGVEIEIPELYNNSPIRCVRLVFRMSPDNEDVVNGFIQSVTISRKYTK